MQRRELILLLAFLGIIIYQFAGESLANFVMGPLWEAKSNYNDASKQFDSAEITEINDIRKKGRVSKWTRQSLPPSPEKATLVYKEWLHDLAEVALKFQNVKVTPERLSAKKKNNYVGVQIKVVAEGTVDQVRQFLYRFYQTDLMQRVVSLGLESKSNQGDPVLEMTLTAEAVSLPGATPSTSPSLFSRTKLSDAIDAEATSWKITGADDIKRKAPFRVRIGSEYANVTKVDGASWTITRGYDSSTAAKHEEGALVELAPVREDMQSSTLEEFAPLVELNPFAKPTKYEPKLEITGERAIAQDQKLELQAKANGFDPKKGKPVISLADVAEQLKGLEFDAESGKIVWTPGKEVALGQYKFTLKASSPAVSEPLSETITVTLRNLNTAPVIEKVENQTAIIGQELAVDIKASDNDEPSNNLTYALPEGSPMGSSIDPSTGALKWTPDVSSEPGRVELTVNVTDDGSPAMTSSIKIIVDLLDDAAQFTHLTGIFAADDERHARFYDRSNDKFIIARQGGSLKYAGIDAKVLTIGRDYMVMKIKDETFRLELGKQLRNMKKIENPQAKNVQSPSSIVPKPVAGP